METVEILIPTSEPPYLGEKPERDPLFRARGLTKIYPTGDIEVRALDGALTWIFSKANSSCYSVPPAAENRRYSAFWVDWMCQLMER